ncbi:internal scaffolding protein [Microvirus sp.]|nr:internal scaffolding protein [Microvirus sp.]
MRCSTLSHICDGNTFISSSGSPVKLIFTPAFEDGQIVLNETGKFDISEFINSYADSTDMSFILARLAAGDSSVLTVSQGFFGDSSFLSHDHRAALDTVISAQTYFDNLPKETRDKFNDSFVEWIQSAGTPEWISRMVINSASPAPDNSTESEVKPDEP